MNNIEASSGQPQYSCIRYLGYAVIQECYSYVFMYMMGIHPLNYYQ